MKIKPTQSLIELSDDQLRQAGIPEGFWNLDIEKYQGTESAKKQVRAYVHNLSHALSHTLGLCFEGPSNSFKTFLMCYCGIHALGEGYSVLYLSLPRFADDVVGKVRSVESVIATQFVLIDDLASQPNSFHLSLLQQLLVGRKNAGKPTLFTSSLEARTLKATYGDVTARLIADFSQKIQTHVDDRVMDLKKAEARSIFVEEV